MAVYLVGSDGCLSFSVGLEGWRLDLVFASITGLAR